MDRENECKSGRLKKGSKRSLFQTRCPRKESGRKIGIMELTKRLWDAKGYAELKKSSQNLRDHDAKIIKA